MSTDTLVPATRGDTTREALIQAAIEAFGRDGFSAASTRTIAEAAGVNQALIGYHFRGKPGLYLAALEHIAAAVQQRIGPLVTAIAHELGVAEPRGDAPAAGKKPIKRSAAQRERYLDALQRLTDAFVAMLTSDESAAWARLILREQQDPSAGFEVIYSGIMNRLLSMTATLVAGVRGAESTAAESRMTAIAILGQALVFRTARAGVMRQMGWKRIGPEQVATIQAELRRNVVAILERELRR